MPVYKPDRDSTKLRVVYLSNICEKNLNKSETLCINQCLYPGPNMNSKLSVIIHFLRFDRFLVCFDLVKAFLNLSLNETDSSKLLVWWFRDIDNGNFNLVPYKNRRLCFGLTCSPSLLMLALKYILVVSDDGSDPERTRLRELVNSLFYMDNGSISAQKEMELESALTYIVKILKEHKFEVQQIVSNSKVLDDSGVFEQKLFGLIWNTESDSISPKKLYLDTNCTTKRGVLKACAMNFDPNNYLGPLLNRAKIFLQSIQNDNSLKWDDVLPDHKIKEWKLISRELNRSENIEINRYIGPRDSRYALRCYTDASRQLYGLVIYIVDLNTNKVSLLMSKSKVITKSLTVRSIPTLEFHALFYGVEVLMGIMEQLCNPQLACRIQIEQLEVYCDSMVSLHWLQLGERCSSLNSKIDVFLRNRLNKIKLLCERNPISFRFIDGKLNPADFASRQTSLKQLKKSNYFSGPNKIESLLEITVPPSFEKVNVFTNLLKQTRTPLLETSRVSTYSRLVRIHSLVHCFINKLKTKMLKNNLNLNYKILTETEIWDVAKLGIIIEHQTVHFGKCFDYLDGSAHPKKDMPREISQLNLFIDEDGILKVKSKISRNLEVYTEHPILLDRDSHLTSIIIRDIHLKMNHSGKYTVLSQFRKDFYIFKVYSKVKSVIKDCNRCKRFYNHPIKINQSDYREFRISPKEIPFRSIFIDHIGPINVMLNGIRRKVYILIITCLFTRAVNLVVSRDLSTDEFLLAFQRHV